ncbi:MAG TPA: uroporphyrinogen decarboxylase family protein [Clostridia bacterium]|nr:uroporphyrinogen decarboxylase family protein [Clostridia bacterium]HPQ47564.1 uroporphyrinogen decarboxylase family protein [Clostridia bacterium]
MDLNSRERLLNSIRGKETDRLAWSPFLAYFWDYQPESVKKAGQLQFLKEIGADPLFRGFCTLIKVNYKKSNVIDKTSGNERVVIHETPVGNLETRYTYTTNGNTWFITKHPVKTGEDLKVLTYLNEDMVIEADFSKYRNGLALLGEEALLIPIITPEMKSSFQSMIETWMGTEEVAYAVYDYEDELLACLDSMKKNSIKSVEMAVECGAEAYIFWEDSSTGNLSPAFFREYISDEISAWADIIHREGSLLVHHACGQIKGLISDMSKTGADVIESISPPPTGDLHIYDARKMAPENICLIGGIEPTVLLNSKMDELRDHVADIIERTGKKGFVLANADSCPPGVEVDKFRMISELVKSIGR